MKKICILLSLILAFQIFPVFAEQSLNADVLFFDDFEEQDESAWTTDSGDVVFIEEEENENIAYSVGAGDYFQKEIMSGMRNYSYSFDMFMDYRDENGQFGNTWPTMRFRASDDSYYHMYLYNKEGYEEIGFQKMVDGEETWLFTANVPLVEDNEKWVSIKVALVGSKIEVYYKDMKRPIISYDDVNGAVPKGGNFYFISNGASAFYIDNLKVEQTKPEHEKAEDISKESGREIYRFYDYETDSENENIKEDESKNHYFDAQEAPLELGEYNDFICKFNWVKDYKPYGENQPVFSFGSEYEIELDSSLENGGIVLKKDGEEIEKAELILADYDNAKTAIMILAIANQIEVYYHDLTAPILTFNAEENISLGEISIFGGAIDNIYLASAYRFKPIEILTSASEIQDEQMTVTIDAVSHLEEDIAANVLVAGYLPDGLCALAQTEQVFKGNDINAEEKINTQVELIIPYIEDAQYYILVWDVLKPLADLCEVGALAERISMPPSCEELPELDVNVEFLEGKIKINGSVEVNTEQSITLLVQKSDASEPDTEKAVYLAQITRPDDEGLFSAEFSTESLEEGDYTAFAACDDANAKMVQFEYINPENLDLFIEKLNLAATSEEMREILSDNTNLRYADRLGINIEKMLALESEILINGICARMFADKEEGLTKENAGKIFSSHLGFALLKTAKDGAELYEIISDNPEFYQMDSKYTEALENIKKEAVKGIYAGLKSNVYDDLESVMDTVGVNVILSEIYLTKYKDTYDLLKKYEEEINLDLSKLDTLSATKAASVYKILNENRLYSLDELLKVYNDAINEQTKKPSSAPRPVGGGGGGGGGSYVRIEATPVPELRDEPTAEPVAIPTQAPEEKITYKDLSKEHWANEAVEFLSALKPPVISGYEDGAFYPDKCITRAEFVKLIINAFKFEMSEAQCTFKDVSSDSWYYAYIAAAEKTGIITGTDSGDFHPNEEISRQDMAVMLHRVLEIKLISLNAVKEAQFSDKDTVSVYAQKAVEMLGAAGIINGTDEGKLNPFASATRAQAAKMIYEILK